MNSFAQLLGGPAMTAPVTMEEGLMALLLAFVLSQMGAWVYMYTHHGLSYSRSFVQSIVLLTVIMTLGLMAIGSNIAVAFGLVGALSVIRFRNILKDTRDTAFIFFALVTSMACGTRSFGLAVVGAVVFAALVLYLHWTQFGSKYTGDGFVRFHWETARTVSNVWLPVLNRHCRYIHLVSQRFHEGGQGEAAYRLVMRDPRLAERMVEELKGIEGLFNVNFVLQEDETEL